MKKRTIIYLNVLVIIFLFIIIFSINNKTSLINKISFKNDNVIENNYEIEQVKLFAITLEAQSEYIENIKTTPLTCNINIERVTRILYIDEDKQIGEKSVIYKEPVGILMQPIKKGYNFEMWTNENQETIDEQSIIESTTDYKIYANWNIIISNLIVNPNGGTWNESVGEQLFSLEYSETKEIPDPTRIGYTFNSWEITGADSIIENKTFKMGTENTTIKAIWNADEYKLTINPNGGTYNNSTNLTEMTIAYDSKTKINTPTRKGYTFIGWTISNGILNGDEFTMNYTGDVTITANWQVNNYKYIVYHKQQSIDGTAYNIVADDTITGIFDYGTTIIPKINDYTGFIKPNAQSLTIDVDTDPPVKNIVNYNYNRSQFILTINPNYGIWNGSSSTKKYNLFYQQSYTIANPTRTGYNFIGWNNDDPNSNLEDQIFTMNLKDATLTAVWEARKYTLTYSVNGGNAISPTSKTITYDSPYGTLPTPTRRGYKFEGWYTSATSGSKVTEATIHKSESNITLYAHWSNTAPTTPVSTITYLNSGSTENGILKNGTETATLVAKSTDLEDISPTINIKCVSVQICTSLCITTQNVSSGQSTFKINSTSIGVGVIEITATDKAGLKSSTRVIIIIYSEDNGELVEAKYTVTTYDSGWIDYLEGFYISNFTFEVKFASGHNNSSNTDNMAVYGMTESGKEVVLYTWTGNMQSTLHASNLKVLNSLDEKIRQIRFYTYSPHDDCAKSATIKYSIYYKFDPELMESTYKPIN